MFNIFLTLNQDFHAFQQRRGSLWCLVLSAWDLVREQEHQCFRLIFFAAGASHAAKDIKVSVFYSFSFPELSMKNGLASEDGKEYCICFIIMQFFAKSFSKLCNSSNLDCNSLELHVDGLNE